MKVRNEGQPRGRPRELRHDRSTPPEVSTRTSLDSAAVRGFLTRLCEWRGCSQAEIGRQAGVSQSWVNKIVVGNSMEPELASLKHVIRRFSAEWARYLEESPELQANVREDFFWVMPVFSNLSVDPDLAEAIGYVRQMFETATPSQREMIVCQLRSQAEFILKPSARPARARVKTA